MVCGEYHGAVTSLGAAMSILDGTGPLTSDGTWGKHMEYTSAALQKIGHINGPQFAVNAMGTLLCFKRQILQAHTMVCLWSLKPPRCHYSAQMRNALAVTVLFRR